MSKLNKDSDYQVLIENIGVAYQLSKAEVISAVNVKMLEAYWKIGR